VEYTSFADFKNRAGYEIDGAWYPRVTSIVSIKAKPGLYRYYAGMPNMRAADEAKERSAAEGTAVHAAVERMLKGKPVEVPEEIRPSLDAFSVFLQNHNVTPLLIEERVVSAKHRYAGTVDAVAEVNGVVGVLDIKTSKSIYRDYGMQTSAYATALRESPSLPQPQVSWILRLDQCCRCLYCDATLRTKGGNVKVNGKGSRTCSHQWGSPVGEFEFSELVDHNQDFQAFLAAKALWEWEHRDYLMKMNI
jgi:hypothetical protein